MRMQMTLENTINMLKVQFKTAFMPETNRERALVSMLEDAKDEISRLEDQINAFKIDGGF
jgi:hypothetical protein